MATFRIRATARLTPCSLCMMSICNYSYLPFGFEGKISVLIALVTSHCLLVAFGTGIQ